MFEIITTKFVREKLGLPDDDALNTSIRKAIQSATPFIEIVLSSKLSKATHSDVFYINPAIEVCVASMYVLKLSSGFVASSPAPILHQSNSIKSVQSIALDSPGLDYYKLDPEVGHLYVSEDLEGSYLRVQFTAGFDTPDESPEWLKEVCLYQVVSALSAQQVGDEKPGLDQVYDYLKEQQRLMLDTKRRTNNFAIPRLL